MSVNGRVKGRAEVNGSEGECMPERKGRNRRNIMKKDPQKIAEDNELRVQKEYELGSVQE